MICIEGLGIVLATYAHGENGQIAHIFFKEYGRYVGYGTRQLGIYEGGEVYAIWKARTEDMLGRFTIESVKNPPAHAMRLWDMYTIQMGALLLTKLLPERYPYPLLYAAWRQYLEASSLDMYIRFEVFLLKQLGFSLSLDMCADTGTKEDLCYVSPKTGRAVSKTSGAPYRHKLLRLPAFLVTGKKGTLEDYREGLRLTQFFLEKNMDIAPAAKKARQLLMRSLGNSLV